jgi:purine catabolism regulator
LLVEDAARQQEATLALSAQVLELAIAGRTEMADQVLAKAGRQLPVPPLRVLMTSLRATEPRELEHLLSVRAGNGQRPVLATRWQGAFAAVVEEATAHSASGGLATRRMPVVVSGSVAWAGVGAALRQARDVLDQGRTPSTVIELETREILGLLSRPEVAAVAERRLAPLLVAPDGPELRRTLEVWLHHNAAWDPAARELGMHRHTLKGHVHRAATLLGLELDRFEAKAELWAMLAAG